MGRAVTFLLLSAGIFLCAGTTAFGQDWGRIVYTQKKAALHVQPSAASEVNEHLVVGTKIKVDYCGAEWCAVFWAHARERELKQSRGFVRLTDVGEVAPPQKENPRLRRILKRSSEKKPERNPRRPGAGSTP